MADNQVWHFINTVVGELYVDRRDDNGNLDEFVQNIYKYACNNECINNKIGSCYNYFSVRGKDDIPVLMFSKTSKKMKTQAVSSYSQCYAWGFHNAWLKESFLEIFSTSFLDENQVDAYAGGDKSVKFENGKDIIAVNKSENIKIDKTALKTVIARVLIKWLMNDRQVVISVPDNEYDYNGYVLRAAREIYSYFPNALKTEAGFSSFLPESKFKDYQRIYVVFVPEQVAPKDAIRLDGSSPLVYSRLLEDKSVGMFEGFIDYIISLTDPKERQEYLNEMVYEDLENKIDSDTKDSDISWVKNFDPLDYCDYSNSLRILDANCKTMEMYQMWTDFANSSNVGKYTNIENRIWKKIKKEINAENLAQYVTSRLELCRTVTDEIESAKTVSEICKDRPELKKTLWECISNSLSSGKYSDRMVYDSLKNTAQELGKLYGCDVISLRDTYAAKCSETIITKAKAEIDSIANGKPDLSDYHIKESVVLDNAKTDAGTFLLDEDVKKIEEQLNIYAFNYVLETVQAKFNVLNKNITKTPEEIKKRIADLSPLLEELYTPHLYVRQTQKYKELHYGIDSARNAEEEKSNASASILNEIKDQIKKSFERNYFKCIELAAPKYNQLDDEIKVKFKAYFKAERINRIKTYKEYEEQFEGCYNSPLKIGNISKASPIAQEIIISDLSEILPKTHLELEGHSAEEILRNATEVNGTVSQFSNGTEARFTLNGDIVGFKELSDLLTLSCTQSSRNTENRIKYLINKRAFNGNHLIPLRSMYEKCGLNQDALIEYALDGKFANADETTYQRLLEDWIKYKSKGRRRSESDIRSDLIDTRNRFTVSDATARNALEGLIKQYDKELKKKEERKNNSSSSGKTIAIIILSTLLAAAIGLGTFQFFKIRKLIGPEGIYTELAAEYCEIKVITAKESIQDAIDIATGKEHGDVQFATIKAKDDFKAAKSAIEEYLPKDCDEVSSKALINANSVMDSIATGTTETDRITEGLLIVQDAFNLGTDNLLQKEEIPEDTADSEVLGIETDENEDANLPKEEETTNDGTEDAVEEGQDERKAELDSIVERVNNFKKKDENSKTKVT